MRILTTRTFAKNYRKLPRRVRILASEKCEIFRKNPFEPTLRTHKLKGELAGYFAFSINLQYRILFRFGGGGEVYFVAVGTHEIYF